MLIKTEPYYQRARAHDSSDLSVSRFFFFLLFFSLSLSFNVLFRFLLEKRKKEEKKEREERGKKTRIFSSKFESVPNLLLPFNEGAIERA